MTTALDLAVQNAGSISALSRELDVSHQVVNRWTQRGFAPLKRARQIAALYNLPLRELVDPALCELLDDPSFV